MTDEELIQTNDEGRIITLPYKYGTAIYKVMPNTAKCYGEGNNCIYPVERCPYRYGYEYCHRNGSMKVVTEYLTDDDIDFNTKSLKKNIYLTYNEAVTALVSKL